MLALDARTFELGQRSSQALFKGRVGAAAATTLPWALCADAGSGVAMLAVDARAVELCDGALPTLFNSCVGKAAAITLP